MSDSPADPPRPVPTPDRENAPRQIDLHRVIVRYDGGPDRCTVYPAGECCCARADAWLTADADAFVSLDEMR